MPSETTTSILPPHILDTNIVIHYVRDDAIKLQIESNFGLLMAEKAPLVIFVIEAETRSIAARNGWGVGKRDQMEFLFSTFRRVPVERDDIMNAYLSIDVYSHSQGIDMGKNDLLIAATASVTGATLLTTDKDFDHLDPRFLTRVWIDPTKK